MTFWYGSEPDLDPAHFFNGFQDANKMLGFFSSGFLLITYRRYIYISLQRFYKLLKCHKTVNFFAFRWNDPDLHKQYGSGSEKTYGFGSGTTLINHFEEPNTSKLLCTREEAGTGIPDPWHFGTVPEADPVLGSVPYLWLTDPSRNIQWFLGCK